MDGSAGTLNGAAVNGHAVPLAQFRPPPSAPLPPRQEQRQPERQEPAPASAPGAAPKRQEEHPEQRREEPSQRAPWFTAVRVISACYALMAIVTIVATGIGFWLSYAGLHTFATRAGLTGLEAWAWPSSVDLFILAGELGITISTLRDGKADWRAWGYFAAGCIPSVTFNVLHVAVQAPDWGRYAVAATPPIAAMLALAALMQQVISLPAALRHMHGAGSASGQPPATPAPNARKPRVTAPAKRQAAAGKRASARATAHAKAAAVLAQNPGLSPADLAKKAKVSRRTANRALKDAREAASAPE